MQDTYFNNTCPVSFQEIEPADKYMPDVWFYVWFGIMAAITLAFNHRFPPTFDFEQ